MFDPSIWSKLHGASTHFPIALMLMSVLCDGASFLCKNYGLRQSYRFVATVAIVLGALGSYAAVITGLVITRGQMWGHATMLRHHQFVWPAFALMTGLAAWRVFARGEPSSKSAAVHLVLMVVTAALMSGAGFGAENSSMKAKAEHGRSMVISLAVSVLSLAGAWAVAAGFGPSTADAPVLPVLPVTQRADGRAMFVQSCSHCHGDDATGNGEDGDGPDLRGLRISNARIATVIRQGIHGEMPSFAKKYSASDIAPLVEYLRSLQ